MQTIAQEIMINEPNGEFNVVFEPETDTVSVGIYHTEEDGLEFDISSADFLNMYREMTKIKEAIEKHAKIKAGTGEKDINMDSRSGELDIPHGSSDTKNI